LPVKTVIRVLSSALSLSALAACQPSEGQAVSSASSMQMEGHTLAQAACSGCHSIEPFGLSPNSAAPEFPMIANRDGLTTDTLTYWLRNAHNYPEEMDFYLEDDEVGQLVDYILTLQDESYAPPI